MKAVIIALDRCIDGPQRIAPPILLPLLDRPFVQHLVERLIDAGIVEFDVLMDERTRGIASLFGNGGRWGIAIRYHQLHTSQGLLPHLKELAGSENGEPILLATADALAAFRQDSLVHSTPANQSGRYSCREATAEENWSGWALVDHHFFAALPSHGDMDTIQHSLQRTYEMILPSELLHASSYSELLEAQRALNYDHITRSARVHPSVRLTGPVYLGEYVRIESGACLGPNVVVGAGSVIGVNTSVRNSLICPGTYVGKRLEIDRLILDGKEVYHSALRTSVTIQEPIFLSRLAR